MVRSIIQTTAVCVVLACGSCGCARETSTQTRSPTPAVSFDDARARCGVTVVDTDEVKRCMRRQGWAYRLPWE